MRDYRVNENPLKTMEYVASNHKIDLKLTKMKNGKFKCKDDEGNVWIGLPRIFDFFNEFLMDDSLCTLEQINQIEILWLQEEGKFVEFPLCWLKEVLEKDI
ncbi:MAG: hypothetical protein RSA96_08005 [Erysipelotrichaceae bacterium]